MAGGLYFENFAKIITEAKIGISLAYFKTTSYFWCIAPLSTFNGVADMMADDVVTQQQPGEREVQVRQPVNQAGADVGRGQVVGDVTQQAQEADGAVVGRDVQDVI